MRLPTEAEWEYGARGSKSRKYAWGDAKPGLERANYGEGKIGRTTPVGMYGQGQTPEGIYDLAGNVWEWCRDSWRGEAYQGRGKGVIDPVEQNVDEMRRSPRGGSWDNGAWSLAAACRYGYRSWNRVTGVGFRCVVSVAAEHD